MSRNFIRIVTALTGPALAVGILAGSITAATSAQAQMSNGQARTCTTSVGVGAARSGAPSPMTRAGKLNAAAPSAASAPTSCIGH